MLQCCKQASNRKETRVNVHLPQQVHLNVVGRHGLHLGIENHLQNLGQLPPGQLDHGKAQPNTPAVHAHIMHQPLWYHLHTMTHKIFKKQFWYTKQIVMIERYLSAVFCAPLTSKIQERCLRMAIVATVKATQLSIPPCNTQHSSGQFFLNATSRVLTKITNCRLTSPPINAWEGTRN